MEVGASLSAVVSFGCKDSVEEVTEARKREGKWCARKRQHGEKYSFL